MAAAGASPPDREAARFELRPRVPRRARSSAVGDRSKGQSPAFDPVVVRALLVRGCRSGVSPPGRSVAARLVGASFHVAGRRCLCAGGIIGHASLGPPSFWRESGLADAGCATAFATPCACACTVAAVGGKRLVPSRGCPAGARAWVHGNREAWRLPHADEGRRVVGRDDAGCGHPRGLPLSDRVAVLLRLADPCLARGRLRLVARGEAASAAGLGGYTGVCSCEGVAEVVG
jgi:hypothetical protein